MQKATKDEVLLFRKQIVLPKLVRVYQGYVNNVGWPALSYLGGVKRFAS